MHYNTTNLKGGELKAAQDKARTQEQDVYEILFLANRPLGASEVMERMNHFNKRPPITSVRRAISNLKKSGQIIRRLARMADANMRGHSNVRSK